MFIGIAGGAFNQAREMEMSYGEQPCHRPVPPGELPASRRTPSRSTTPTTPYWTSTANGKYVTQLSPEKRTYFAGTDHEQSSTIVALHSTARGRPLHRLRGQKSRHRNADHQGLPESADRVDLDRRGDCGAGTFIALVPNLVRTPVAGSARRFAGRAARRRAGRDQRVIEGAPCVSSDNSGALTSRGPIFWARTVQTALLCVVTIVDAGRGPVALRPPRPRADVLLRMRPDPAGVQPRQLPGLAAHDRRAARAARDRQERRAVLNWFAAKYGATILAAPIRGGFDNVAWIVPIAVFMLATLGTFVVVWLWKRRSLALAGARRRPVATSCPRTNQPTGRGPARAHSPRDGVLNGPHRRYLRPHPRAASPSSSGRSAIPSCRPTRPASTTCASARRPSTRTSATSTSNIQAGKYPEADYAEQRRALEDEAAQVIAEMEGLTARGMKSTRAGA
jgi:hypothetical protein